MICPKCHQADLLVTHTYSSGGALGKFQRLACPQCKTVATAQTLLVNTNPKKGHGAAALAKKSRPSG